MYIISLQFLLPVTLPTMNFDDYSLPLPHLSFSADYFSKLVFSQAAELQYPAIAPPGAVTSQKFLTKEPTHTSATLVFPVDVIPNICDLLPTTSEMEDAYAEGMRSVLVEFQINNDEYHYCYHFMEGTVLVFKFYIQIHISTLFYYRSDILPLSVITKSMWM